MRDIESLRKGGYMRRRIPHKMDEKGEETKYCKVCDKWFSLSCFNKKMASWDGLETKCKECAQKKSSKFRQDNPSYDKEYQSKNMKLKS